MTRILSIAAIAVSIVVANLDWAVAADNPVLRKLIEQAIRKELSKHDSQEKAWYSEKENEHVTREPITKKVIARWSDESKSWVWLDDPKENLAIDVGRFEIKDGRVYFAVSAKSKVKFKAWGKIPNVVTADARGSARAEISVEGSAKLEAQRFSDAKVSEFKGKLSDVRFSNDVARQIEGLLKDALNLYIQYKEKNLRKDVEDAINGVTF
jgi:hypothetical protein